MAIALLLSLLLAVTFTPCCAKLPGTMQLSRIARAVKPLPAGIAARYAGFWATRRLYRQHVAAAGPPAGCLPTYHPS
jgi:multidrug efflux pump subunit AcrB